MTHGYSSLDPQLHKQRFEMDIFDQIDVNHDGVVTREEFQRAMQACSGLLVDGARVILGFLPLGSKYKT